MKHTVKHTVTRRPSAAFLPSPPPNRAKYRLLLSRKWLQWKLLHFSIWYAFAAFSWVFPWKSPLCWGEITVVTRRLGCQEHHRASVPLMKSFLTDRTERRDDKQLKEKSFWLLQKCLIKPLCWLVSSVVSVKESNLRLIADLHITLPSVLPLTCWYFTKHLVYRLLLSTFYRGSWGRLNKERSLLCLAWSSLSETLCYTKMLVQLLCDFISLFPPSWLCFFVRAPFVCVCSF